MPLSSTVTGTGQFRRTLLTRALAPGKNAASARVTMPLRGATRCLSGETYRHDKHACHNLGLLAIGMASGSLTIRVERATGARRATGAGGLALRRAGYRRGRGSRPPGDFRSFMMRSQPPILSDQPAWSR